MISKKKKFIFFRIPKSASKSMDFALRPYYTNNNSSEYNCRDESAKHPSDKRFSKHMSFLHLETCASDKFLGRKNERKIILVVEMKDLVYMLPTVGNNHWGQNMVMIQLKCQDLIKVNQKLEK